MRRFKHLIRALVFLLVLALAFACVQSLFTVRSDRSFQAERGLYKERRNALDAVYIGASNVYASYQPPLGWRYHGVAVYTVSVASAPPEGLKYLMIEARKTQPDALYIVNINNFKPVEVTVDKIHRLVDYMAPSLNKVRMISALCDAGDIHGTDRLEFYFPIIRFHSDWPELKDEYFTRTLNGLKDGSNYSSFLKKSTDLSGEFEIAREESELEERQTAILEDFLAYCDEVGANVLFITVPQTLDNDQREGQFNTMERIVRERGYDCLDTMELMDEIGLRTDSDFYNGKHMNVHGSLKFSDYLARYLVENYGFRDKRGEADYKSWDASVEKYETKLAPWSLPLERELAARDYDLAAPAVSARAEGRSLRLSWSASEGAEGYEIYRKSSASGDKNWALLAVTDGGAADYTDEGLADGVTYTYTVVPFRTEQSGTLYGCFNVLGVAAGTEDTAQADAVPADSAAEEGGE